jgi:hypothetical protein
LDRILLATNVDIKQAQASVESDRKFILNTITGLSLDDAVVNDHDKYDELNNILRGIFVTPALQRIIKEMDEDTITRCLEIVKASNARMIDLDLKDCSKFDDDILIRLADSLPPTLTDFRLESIGSAVTVHGMNACLKKIVGCPHLVNLNLEFNNIDDDGAKQIAYALEVNDSLEELILSYNNISDDGVKQITYALKDNHSLKTLILNHNKISYDGAKMIADGLNVNHSLESLYLYNNSIDADGKENFSKRKQELKDVNCYINIYW